MKLTSISPCEFRSLDIIEKHLPLEALMQIFFIKSIKYPKISSFSELSPPSIKELLKRPPNSSSFA